MFGIGICGTPGSRTSSEPMEVNDNFYENLENSIPTTEQMRSGWRNKGEVQSKTRCLVEMCLEELSLAAFPELTLRKEISVCHYPLGAVHLAYEVLNKKIKYVYLRAHENGVDRHLIFSAILDPDLEEARPNRAADNNTQEADQTADAGSSAAQESLRLPPFSLTRTCKRFLNN